MDFFHYQNNDYYCEAVPLHQIAQQFGTPCYIYSRATIERHWHAFDTALGQHPHLICYAVKANSNLAILNLLARLGSGFDIVSVGELERVLRAGGDPAKVVFSGVGKTAEEIRRGLAVGIRCFNVESASELQRIADIASQLGCVAPISLRVNPDVDAKTHPYISTGLKENKFGIAIAEAADLYRKASKLPSLQVKGIDCHIGSQLTSLQPFLDALDRVLALTDQLAQDGIHIQHLDLGGGLGVRYRDETPPEPAQYAAQILEKLSHRNFEILLEPGRAIMANAGVFLTKVELIKSNEEKNFAVVDGAMNDLIRPVLYDAWQEILTCKQKNHSAAPLFDIVGPVCETGDFLGKDRQLVISEGELLVVRSAGAYGFSMSSNYNSRPRVAEVMVDGADIYLIRKRETFEHLMYGEALLP